MRAVAVIPARGCGKRCPGKNIRELDGVPVILRTIDTLRESSLFDLIVVSTDDELVAKIASRSGAEVFQRAFDNGDRGTQEVTAEALHFYTRPVIACCVYPVSPLLLVDDLHRAAQELAATGAQYAVSVGAEPLRDVGCFYYGYARAFRASVPLWTERTIPVVLPEERCCDVNTEDDWTELERKFDRLRHYGFRRF